MYVAVHYGKLICLPWPIDHLLSEEWSGTKLTYGFQLSGYFIFVALHYRVRVLSIIAIYKRLLKI